MTLNNQQKNTTDLVLIVCISSRYIYIKHHTWIRDCQLPLWISVTQDKSTLSISSIHYGNRNSTIWLYVLIYRQVSKNKNWDITLFWRWSSQEMNRVMHTRFHLYLAQVVDQFSQPISEHFEWFWLLYKWQPQPFPWNTILHPYQKGKR